MTVLEVRRILGTDPKGNSWDSRAGHIKRRCLIVSEIFSDARRDLCSGRRQVPNGQWRLPQAAMSPNIFIGIRGASSAVSWRILRPRCQLNGRNMKERNASAVSRQNHLRTALGWTGNGGKKHSQSSSCAQYSRFLQFTFDTGHIRCPGSRWTNHITLAGIHPNSFPNISCVMTFTSPIPKVITPQGWLL
jgi:hypothetical protein